MEHYFVYTLKNRAFSARNSTKIAQERYVMISCTDSYQNRSRITDRACINALTDLILSLSPFRQTYPSSTFRNSSYHEFLGNLTEGLAVDIE